MDLPMCDNLAELAKLTQRSQQLFLRYSPGPEDDADETSSDYESGAELPGLSVNPLSPESWWKRPLEDWLARQVRQYAHLKEDSDDERCAYVLEGRVAARGPDNEPLIVEARPVAYLSDDLLREARKRYEERFDTGKDSRGE